MFCLFFPLCLSQFSDYFLVDGLINSSFYQGIRNIIGDGRFFISNCKFHFLASTIDGSAIYANNIIANVVIEECSFISCSSLQLGGAVYFVCPNGQFAMAKCCAHNCSSGKEYHYQFFIASTSENRILIVSSNSINQCSLSPYSRYYAFFLSYGNQTIGSTNNTRNILLYYSGYECRLAKSSISKFNNLANNWMDNGILLCWRNCIDNNFQFCNLINNSQGNLYNNLYGIVLPWDNSVVNLFSCVFLNNAKSGNGALFSITAGCTVTVDSCYIDIITYSINQATVINPKTAPNPLPVINENNCINHHYTYQSSPQKRFIPLVFLLI